MFARTCGIVPSSTERGSWPSCPSPWVQHWTACDGEWSMPGHSLLFHKPSAVWSFDASGDTCMSSAIDQEGMQTALTSPNNTDQGTDGSGTVVSRCGRYCHETLWTELSIKVCRAVTQHTLKHHTKRQITKGMLCYVWVSTQKGGRYVVFMHFLITCHLGPTHFISLSNFVHCKLNWMNWVAIAMQEDLDGVGDQRWEGFAMYAWCIYYMCS